jgi:AcrR family transcriptional regulator
MTGSDPVAAPAPSRRVLLAEAATEYVLERGIAGLSLRPLAAALDTSDRMLVYHFGSKDSLVAEVIERSNDRSVAVVAGLPPEPSAAEAVAALWRVWHAPVVDRCLRVYAQSAALGLLGQEPYLSAARRANRSWTKAITDYLCRSGVPTDRAQRVGALVDATLFGLWLDQPVDSDSGQSDRVVADLADTVDRLSAPAD